jgi:hypothetical protein
VNISKDKITGNIKKNTKDKKAGITASFFINIELLKRVWLLWGLEFFFE